MKKMQKNGYNSRHNITDNTSQEPGDEVWVPDQKVHGEVERQVTPRFYWVSSDTQWNDS